MPGMGVSRTGTPVKKAGIKPIGKGVFLTTGPDSQCAAVPEAGPRPLNCPSSPAAAPPHLQVFSTFGWLQSLVSLGSWRALARVQRGSVANASWERANLGPAYSRLQHWEPRVLTGQRTPHDYKAEPWVPRALGVPT